MSDKVNTPFSEEHVKKLNEYQNSGRFHPYTCDRKAETCEVHQEPRDYSKDGVLIATTEGWICPCGKYKQNWAHGFTTV